MKSRPAIVCALLLGCVAPAQQPPADSLDALLQSAQQWARENLDDSVLAAFGEVDQDRVRDYFGLVQKRFESTYVYDLASTRQTADSLLPLLQQFEETQPYAIWLKSRLDYFEAAEEMRRRMQPATPPKPGVTVPLLSPSPTLQRSVWDQRLKKRPLPPNAQRYLPKMKSVFVSEKVPPQLVWVAEVESSFDPRAKSPSGAAGMFQLMKPTAKTLGLSTWLPDERLNPEKSARAAAKYLRYLHGRFGDWRLALAAYNAGEGNVSSLLKKSKTRSFDAISSRLPAETQMYVPKVEATLRKREGLSLGELKTPKG